MEVTYVDHMGSDLSVVNAARVSFKKKSEEMGKGDVSLLSYLAKHKHYSPFNHTFVTMHIKAPIFVARQLVKHKFMPWNEVSRRYVDDEPEFYLPTSTEWRGRASDNKQGSAGVANTSQYTRYKAELANDEALRVYQSLLSEGVAPEQARMVLPLNMYTEWYWSGTLRAWFEMCELRLKDDTQRETYYVAAEADAILTKLYPLSWTALFANR